MYKIYTNKAELIQAEVDALRSDEHAKTKLWEVTISWANHAKLTGNWKPLEGFFTAMGPRSQRRERIAAAIRELSQFKKEDGSIGCALNITFKSDGTVKVSLASEKSGNRQYINTTEMQAKRYDEIVKVQRVKAPFELQGSLIALVKRAAKEMDEDEAVIKAQIAKLVAA